MLHHFHHVLIQVTNYEIYNILCLNKLIYTFLDIIVNKRLNKYNKISTLQYLAIFSASTIISACSTVL